MKPTADQIRQAAEQEIDNLKVRSMPNENELHVPVTLHGYFYLVVFQRDTVSERDNGWKFDSIIER